MKRINLHRGMALLLAACMVLSTNSGFVSAADVPLLMAMATTETSGDAPTADSGQGEIADPMGSATEGEPPSVDASVCTCPPVDSGEVAHGEHCPLYEAAKCGCLDGFFERYHIHMEDCPLYTEPDLDALPTEVIAEQLDVPSTKTLTLDENGNTVDIFGFSPRGRAATPAGTNYDADVNAASSVNMNILALAGTPTATMSTVINVPTAPTAGSSTLLSVRFATVGGGKVNIYFNDKKLGETYEALPKNQLTVWLPMHTSWVKSGQNTVRIELVEGSIYFRAARVLLNGGTAFPKITDPFSLQYFEEYADHSGGDMFLRSGFTDFTGMSTFQYTSQGVTTKYKHAIAGNAEINHTVPILEGDGTGCQIFLPDEKGDLIGYTSAQYTLKKDNGLIELNLLEITHEAAAQTPAKDGKPTYSQITVMGRSNAKDLVVTNCSVKEKNGSAAAKVTKVAAGSSDYTFQWSSNELTEVTYTYTQGGTPSTKTYDFQLNLDIYPPYFSTTVVSVPARATPDTLKGLLLAGVYDCGDDLNPLPFDKALTVDITAVNLNIAGNYAAKITAVDAFGNAITKNVTVTVVALPVAMGAVTATPEGDATALSRTFTSAITEDGGKSFTERGFVVGYSNAPTVEDNVYKLAATGENSSFTASKSDFDSNIQYYVRAYGKDSAGVVYYSAPLGFSCGAPGDYGALTAGDLLLEIPYNGITGSATVTGNITITRPGGSAGAVSLTYGVIPGSLTTVTAASGTLQFAAGVYSQTIPISVTDAEQFNGAKSFTVKLTNPTPTTINGSESASVTVSYTTNYLAVLAPAPTSCLLKGIHTQSLETAGAATTAKTAIDFFKVEDGWLCLTPNGSLNRINASASKVAYDTYQATSIHTIIATVDVSAHAGKIWAAGFTTGTYSDKITVTFYSDEAATEKVGNTYTNQVESAGFVCAVPKDSAVTICTDKNTPGGVGNSTERIPVDAKRAKFQLYLKNSGSTSLGGFFFGVKDEPQLAFTRFDSDIDTTRTYYPGDKLRFYPVLNSAVEPLTAASSIMVGATAANYDPAQKSFVYTIPVGATTGALTLTHSGAKYTVKGQTAGADDWCNLTPTGSVSSATVTMAALATVSIMPITDGNNTTHRATVTATGNSGNVEYVWSSTSTPPTGGWQTVPAGGAVAGSGYTGNMHLHAKATNATGKTTYAVSSFSFVAASTFEVNAAPVDWVNAATATITTTSGTGANLVVKVNSGGADTTVTGNSYPVPGSGTYTFTATDSFGFSKKLVRSYSIDKLAPVIEVNKNGYDTSKAYLKIEGITATADDGSGSGLALWQYVWSTAMSAPSSGWAAVPVSGIIPTQSGAADDWSLYLKAVDNAGNTTAQKVGSFTISTAAPTLPTITLTPSGKTIQYSVTKGTNNISQIITPTETIGSGVSDGKTGSFTVERNGVYTVAAVDAKGYTAEKSIVINNIDTDAPTLSAKLYSGASEAVYGTYEKSDSFRVEVTAEDNITPTYEASGQISGYYSSGLTEIKWKKDGGTDATLPLVDGKASFAITENGSYIITATDTAGNTATQTLRVKSIDNSAPVITPAAPPTNGWDAVGSVVGFTVADTESGVQSVTVSKGGAAVPVTGSYSFTTNGSGTYTITATDKVGNSVDSTVTVSPPVAPAITPSANPTLTYGDLVNVNVTATVTDGGALSYQWYKGTSETDTDPSVKTPIGTATDYAQPSNASRLLAGAHYYFCVVTNTKGGATTSATSSVIAVTVQKKTPDFTFTADKNTAVHGETVKLSATINAASGGSAPIGTVTFKDGDTVLATVPVTRNAASGHGEAVYSYAIPISSSGTLTAAYTSTDNNYNSAPPKTVSVTVNKKPLTITVTAPTNLTYNGMAKAATLGGTTGLTENTDYTLTYTGNNTTTYNSTTAPTDVGDYTATFDLTDEGAVMYDTGVSTLSVSFAIAKAVGMGSVTCADIMFGGTVAPVPVSATNGIADVAYLYKVKNADDNTYRADTPTNVGNYTVKATFAATPNYTEATATADFKITPAAVTGITVTPYSGVYDGDAHPIVTVTGALPGDKVFYQLPSSSYTETLPTVTTVADSKSVIVKVTRANHVDFVSGWSAAKVTQKEVAVDFTVPTSLVYNGDPKTVTAEITNKVVTDDVDVTLDNATGTAVGDYTTEASALTGAAKNNYSLPTPAPFVEWEITGTPYPHTITLPTTTGIIYGQTLSDSTLTGNNGSTGSFTWNDNTVMPPAGGYTATVVFTPTDTNFAPVTRTVQVTVAKADVTLEVSGTKVYHTAPIANVDFAVSNMSGMVNGETDTALLGTLTFTSTGNTNTATVGSYDIAIAQSGTSNYKITTTSVTDGFTVTRAAQTLSGTASYQKLLTDKDFALDVKTDSTDTAAAVTYTLANDGGGSVTLGADGKLVHLHKTGTATITASAAQTANFEAAAPLTITVTVGSMPFVRIQAPEGITTTEAKIGGVVTAGTVPLTGYGLEYKKTADADYTAVSPTEAVNGSVTKLTHSLAGLEKNTEYSVRIWAKTADKAYESITRFRTAAEQPPTGKVEGEITDASGTNTAITVTIEAGNTVIASKTVTAGGGKFTFEALPDGFYNLVANNGKYKVTRMVEIVKGGAVTDVLMEIGKKQSVVEVMGRGTPNVAVDGLPELFENDTLYPQADKDVISAGGTVEFKLTVQKTEASADAEEIGKIAEGKIGAYLDIQILKTVTDQNGRAEPSEQMTDLSGNMVTIVIPLSNELQGKESYTVYRVHGGTAEKLESAYSAASNTLTIKSSLFSSYAIAYTEKSGGDGGSGGGSSHDDDNYDFWQKVKDKIISAEDGDTIMAGAENYDKMPESVMDELRKHPGVTLEITWNGGDKITIPAGGALEKDDLRIYYPLAYLAELYRDSLPDNVPNTEKPNPETGGVWEVNAPATAVQAPAIITPKNEGTAETLEQAELERAAIEPLTAPEIATIPHVAEAADGTPNRSRAMLFTGITIMLAAAAIARGVILWKKKHKEEAFK